jgi:hypothetical protein
VIENNHNVDCGTCRLHNAFSTKITKQGVKNKTKTQRESTNENHGYKKYKINYSKYFTHTTQIVPETEF